MCEYMHTYVELVTRHVASYARTVFTTGTTLYRESVLRRYAQTGMGQLCYLAGCCLLSYTHKLP